MKNAFILSVALFISSIINAQTPAAKTDTPADIKKKIEFKELDHDFGKIPYGKAVSFDLKMKNIGSDSIKLENVQVSCGCTTPKWEPGPYAPGTEFSVNLGFNGYADGHFEKSVAVIFEGGLSQQIKFHGEGVRPSEEANPTDEKTKQGNQ